MGVSQQYFFYRGEGQGDKNLCVTSVKFDSVCTHALDDLLFLRRKRLAPLYVSCVVRREEGNGLDDTILLSIFCLAMMTHIFLRPRPPPPLPPTLPLTPSIICHHDCEIGRAERGLEDRVKRSGGAPRSPAQEKNLYGEGHTKPEKKVGDRANRAMSYVPYTNVKGEVLNFSQLP